MISLFRLLGGYKVRLWECLLIAGFFIFGLTLFAPKASAEVYAQLNYNNDCKGLNTYPSAPEGKEYCRPGWTNWYPDNIHQPTSGDLTSITLHVFNIDYPGFWGCLYSYEVGFGVLNTIENYVRWVKPNNTTGLCRGYNEVVDKDYTFTFDPGTVNFTVDKITIISFGTQMFNVAHSGSDEGWGMLQRGRDGETAYTNALYIKIATNGSNPNSVVYTNTAKGAYPLFIARLHANIPTTTGSISSIKVFLKRDPQYPWPSEWPTYWRPGLLIYDENWNTYCGESDKGMEDIGSDWTEVTFTYQNKLDLSKHRFKYTTSSPPGCGSTDAAAHLLVQADDAYAWTVQINVDIDTSPTKTPVLIVPGIMGTELYNGSDLIWSDLSQMFWDVNDQFITENLSLNENGNSVNTIVLGGVIRKQEVASLFELNIFEDLINNLKDSNYKENESIFFFPYDWRLNLEDTKNGLNQKIEAIKQQTGALKVDVIAHSMGGLLTKAYLEEYGKNSIRKLIFVGTPHLGAPKAGKVLLKGDRFGIPWLEEDRMRELALNSPAVYELLPSPAYFSVSQGYIKPYGFFVDKPFWNYGETKNYLLEKREKNPIAFQKAEEFWNKGLQDYDFSGLDTYNIAGCKTNTQAGYQLAMGNKIIGRYGYASGDETVPMVSAEHINIPSSHKYYVKDGNHAELPSANGVRELIRGILADSISLQDNVSNSSGFCNFKGKALSWHSPVEVHIYQGEKHTGPIENNGIEYGIPGVGYDIIGEEKFIFLPIDEGQQYRVVAKGLDTGTFDYNISEVDNGEYLLSRIFNNIPVTTSTEAIMEVSETSEDNILNLVVDDQVQEIAASATLEGDLIYDLIPPETMLTATGTEGSTNWFKSNVSVSLQATDNNSGVLEIKYSLDNGQTYQDYSSPLSFSGEGEYKILYFASDNAGNDEEIKSYIFWIDMTPPEISVSFGLKEGEFVFRTTDILDQDVIPVCNEGSCEAKDKAGNVTAFEFSKSQTSLQHLLNLVSISYNDSKVGLEDNLFQVKFLDKEDLLKDFNQSFTIKNQEITRVDYKKNRDESKVVNLNTNQSMQKDILGGVHLIELLISKEKFNINIK